MGPCLCRLRHAEHSGPSCSPLAVHTRTLTFCHCVSPYLFLLEDPLLHPLPCRYPRPPPYRTPCCTTCPLPTCAGVCSPGALRWRRRVRPAPPGRESGGRAQRRPAAWGLCGGAASSGDASSVLSGGTSDYGGPGHSGARMQELQKVSGGATDHRQQARAAGGGLEGRSEGHQTTAEQPS